MSVIRLPKLEWRRIKGFPRYAVSSYGDVLSLSDDKIMTAHFNRKRNGYLAVTLYRVRGGRKERRRFYVHRLVLFAFHGPPKRGQECLHAGVDYTDNRAWRIKWGTHPENIATRRHGRENQYTKRRRAMGLPPHPRRKLQEAA